MDNPNDIKFESINPEIPIEPELLDAKPPKKKMKKSTLIIIIVAAVLVLCCCITIVIVVWGLLTDWQYFTYLQPAFQQLSAL